MSFQERIQNLRLYLIRKLPAGALRDGLKFFYWRLPRRCRESKLLAECVRALARSGRIAFVQVGANDGVHEDPIHEPAKAHGWKGLLVEPHPLYFKRLTANYGPRPGLTFVNCAVGPSRARKILYASALDQGVSSFSREHVVKHLRNLQPAGELDIQELPVECVPFMDLVREHGFERVDLLLIDTEGFDFEVLKMIDFGRFQCDVIIYENSHLSEADQRSSFELLQRHGYDPFVSGKDNIALRRASVQPAVQRLLRRAHKL
jgi:FkbM family methyltransferase